MDAYKIFTNLKSILEIYEPDLSVVHHTNDNYYLNTKKTENHKKPEFFGAVQIKKSYVAYHLMPIYYCPALLDNASQRLKDRMQGKSCFNFKDHDEPLYEELKLLTKTAFEKYKSMNKI